MTLPRDRSASSRASPISPEHPLSPRPPIRLDRRWIEPTLAMGAKATPASRSELGALWDQIVHQVVDVAGLALGVHLTAPARAP